MCVCVCICVLYRPWKTHSTLEQTVDNFWLTEFDQSQRKQFRSRIKKNMQTNKLIESGV